MLVSVIITQAQNLANVPNTNFWTATEQLWQAQLAWEQVYAFLAQNDDDYFVTQRYLPGGANAIGNNVSLTGHLTSGSAVVASISSTTNLVAGMVVTDATTASNIPSGTQILSVDSTTQVTLTANAAASATADSLTYVLWTLDSHRSYTYLMTLPTDFYRLRLLQYQSSSGSAAYLPFNKMTLQNYGGTQNTPAYRFEGTNLAVYDPQSYAEYCMWYYPRPVTLTTSSDLSYPNNMIPEAMSYLLAGEIRRKQHQDPALWTSKAGEIMGTMVQQKSRDDASANQPKNIFALDTGLWAF